MKFNFHRVKTPAYITSIALVVIGLLFEMGSMPVLAWIFVILGLVLNVLAVSITGIPEAQRSPRGVGRSEPDTADHAVTHPQADTEQQPVPSGSSRLNRLRPVKDEKPSKRGGSSAVGPGLDDAAASSSAAHTTDGLRDGQPQNH